MRPLLFGASCLVAAAIAGTARLEAHEMGSTRVAVMLHDDRRYEIVLVTDAASLLEKLETAAGPRAGAASAGAPPADVAERLAAFDGVFRSRVIVAFDRVGDRPAIEYVVVPATGMAAPVATIRLTGTIPGTAREFAWAYFWTFTSYALSVQTSAGSDAFVESLEAGQTSTPFSLSGLPPAAGPLRSAWRALVGEWLSWWYASGETLTRK